MPAIILSLLMLLVPLAVGAYPLDGTDYTGIARLEGYRLGQQGKARSGKLHAGAPAGYAPGPAAPERT